MNGFSKLSYPVKFDLVKYDNIKVYEHFLPLFQAHANRNGFGKIITGKVAVPKEGELHPD